MQTNNRPHSQQRPYLETLNLMIKRRNLDIKVSQINVAKPTAGGFILV